MTRLTERPNNIKTIARLFDDDEADAAQPERERAARRPGPKWTDSLARQKTEAFRQQLRDEIAERHRLNPPPIVPDQPSRFGGSR
jgi:hypothetical protein